MCPTLACKRLSAPGRSPTGLIAAVRRILRFAAAYGICLAQFFFTDTLTLLTPATAKQATLRRGASYSKGCLALREGDADAIVRGVMPWRFESSPHVVFSCGDSFGRGRLEVPMRCGWVRGNSPYKLRPDPDSRRRINQARQGACCTARGHRLCGANGVQIEAATASKRQRSSRLERTVADS